MYLNKAPPFSAFDQHPNCALLRHEQRLQFLHANKPHPAKDLRDGKEGRSRRIHFNIGAVPDGRRSRGVAAPVTELVRRGAQD